MQNELTDEEEEMLQREAHRARDPRIQDTERIEELEAEVQQLRATLKKCYRCLDHIHVVAVETPVRQDAIQGKAEIQGVIDTSELEEYSDDA